MVEKQATNRVFYNTYKQKKTSIQNVWITALIYKEQNIKSREECTEDWNKHLTKEVTQIDKQVSMLNFIRIKKMVNKTIRYRFTSMIKKLSIWSTTGDGNGNSHPLQVSKRL